MMISLKKTFLFLSAVGALAPFAAYFSLLPRERWGEIFAPPGESSALVFALGLQLFVAAMAVIRGALANSQLNPRQRWTVIALCLSLGPACALGLYFYYTWEE